MLGLVCESMKQLKRDKLSVSLRIEELDDLWYLTQLIDQGDLITAKTYRKVKLGGEGDRAKVEKRPVTLRVRVESVEFLDGLRIRGVVEDGLDDIPKGSHHNIGLEVGSDFILEKGVWLGYHWQRLDESLVSKGGLLLVMHDRERALFALSKRSGYEILSSIKGDVSKKDDRASTKGSFYEEVIAVIKTYLSRFDVERVVLASPAFFKEDLLKLADKDLVKKIVLATCHSVEENAIGEIMKSSELQKILSDQRASGEAALVDELLSHIGKQNNKAIYGFTDIKINSESGTIGTLIVTEGFMTKEQKDGDYSLVLETLKMVEGMQGKVHLISSTSDAGRTLDGLGGIAGMLRY